MGSLWISHSTKDNEFVSDVAKKLEELGNTIIQPLHLLDHREIETFIDTIDKTDAVVLIVSKTHLNMNSSKDYGPTTSDFLMTIRNRGKLIIPFILGDDDDDIEPVDSFGYLTFFKIKRDEALSCALQIHKTMLTYKKNLAIEEKKEQEEQEKQLKQKVVRKIISDNGLLERVIIDLKEREKRDKKTAIVCYSAGIVAIIIGAILIYSEINTISERDSLYYYIYLGLKNLVLIGLIIAFSKYAIDLGKSYMNEGIKQADRLHAIKYGQFLLESFEEQLSLSEMKDLFKDWNINNGSTFNGPDQNEFDTTITNILDQLGNLVGQAAKMKKL
ncbi:toll/interleukin-1 receptor domain-containing protein [Priestia aryabhattai]